MTTPKPNVIPLSTAPLPSIAVESSQQNFAETIDLTKIDQQFPGIGDQLQHAQEQLELARRYPGRERSFKRATLAAGATRRTGGTSMSSTKLNCTVDWRATMICREEN